MSAVVYPSAFAALQDGTLDWLADDIRVVLLGPAFVPDFSQQYVDSINPVYVIAESDPLEDRTFVNGLAFSRPAQFLQLLDTQAITHAVIYQDTGDPAYSQLIAYYTDDNLLGSPLVPVGLDQYVLPDAQLGWLTFSEQEFTGEINTYLLAGLDTIGLGEVSGGDIAPASVLLLSGKLTVTTQAVCATPDEPETCCRPTIRSSKCE